jgi:cellulose synthase/poly-beta-1,6-N-acetylglucosamine synthase-like glycosyltransferase
MVRHFADPDIGGVQALILPRQRDGWTRKLRMMEIAWNHLFLRRAQMATLTPQVLDGALCAYRRVDLLHAGGWVPWNGEDSEVTIRLLRIGFRMRFEPDSAGFEDVPADFAALRKQRVRWNRGGLFAHRPHFGALVSEAPEYGGLAILYWFLTFFRGGLRSILYVWAIFATLLLRLPTFEHVVIIAAILLIPRAMVMGYYLAYYHRLTDLHWILFWPVGSAIKQYFALEATGTMLPGSLTEYAE